MASGSRLRENLRAYRKLLFANWNLFKASRVGVVGLAVMIAFLLMALSAPFLNLRDPIRWIAPSSDTVSNDLYWLLTEQSGTFFSDIPPVTHAMAFRLGASSFGALVDRVYLTAGDRLMSFTSWEGGPAWFSTGGRSWINLSAWSTGTVSANLVVVNYGDFVGSLTPGAERYPEYILYVGMSDGKVLAFRDSFSRSFMVNPDNIFGEPRTAKAELVWNTTVAGSVTGIAATSDESLYGRYGGDRVAVVNSVGEVSVFSVGTGIWDLVADPLNEPLPHTLLGRWTSPSALPLAVADGPMRGDADYPQRSPAFNLSGETLAVASTDGVMYALDVSAAGVTERWNLTVVPGATDWTAAPVIARPADTEPHFGEEIVYASGRDGRLVLRYLDGTVVAGWPTGEVIITIDVGGATPDPGRFTQPTIAGPTIFVGSTSGCVYSVRLDGVGNDTGPGSIKWRFCEVLRDQGLAPEFRTAPVAVETTSTLLVGSAIKADSAAATQTNGALYSFTMDEGVLSFRIDIEGGTVSTRPVTWRDPKNIDVGVWFASSGPTTSIYEYAVGGQVTLPSEPTWAHQYSCPGGNGGVCPGYASGNMYWLGLDNRGRDVFSQLVWGSRIALLVGFASAFFTVLIGVIIGLLAGYLGGRVDSVLMRFTDVILVIPGLPLIIIMAAVLGSSIWNIILVIALVGWPGVARVIRAEVLSLKERPFIESARVTGASPTRIMFRHIAPNVMPLAFLFMTFGVSGAILSEAALSFIGLGDVNTVSWGIMLFYVQNSKALVAWWWLLPPGLAITLISLAFFLVGRAFDEIVNPRLRKR
jgi:peptide/nickel transport system permease protein